MRSPVINEGELRGQPANPGSPGKNAIKMECVCVYSSVFGDNFTNLQSGQIYHSPYVNGF